MIKRIFLFWRAIQNMQYITIALSRAYTTMPLRDIDPTDPLSWQFCGFSQGGEDGITDYLASRIRNPNRYFIEIGASDGLENNTSWMAIAKRFSGLMVDGDKKKVLNLRAIMDMFNLGVECLHLLTRVMSGY